MSFDAKPDLVFRAFWILGPVSKKKHTEQKHHPLKIKAKKKLSTVYIYRFSDALVQIKDSFLPATKSMAVRFILLPHSYFYLPNVSLR